METKSSFLVESRVKFAAGCTLGNAAAAAWQGGN